MSMLGIRLETGLAFASLALHAMFVAYLSSYYIALSRPIEGPNIIQFPEQLLIVGLFLFALPGFGLAFVTYFLSKREVPKVVAGILMAQGILMPLGMYYALTLVDNINEEYKIPAFITVPQILLGAGLIPIGLGAHIAKLKAVRRRYT